MVESRLAIARARNDVFIVKKKKKKKTEAKKKKKDFWDYHVTVNGLPLNGFVHFLKETSIFIFSLNLKQINNG